MHWWMHLGNMSHRDHQGVQKYVIEEHVWLGGPWPRSLLLCSVKSFYFFLPWGNRHQDSVGGSEADNIGLLYTLSFQKSEGVEDYVFSSSGALADLLNKYKKHQLDCSLIVVKGRWYFLPWHSLILAGSGV